MHHNVHSLGNQLSPTFGRSGFSLKTAEHAPKGHCARFRPEHAPELPPNPEHSAHGVASCSLSTATTAPSFPHCDQHQPSPYLPNPIQRREKGREGHSNAESNEEPRHPFCCCPVIRCKQDETIGHCIPEGKSNHQTINA